MKREEVYLDGYGKTGDKNLEDRLTKVIKIFSGYKSGKILDIGCGDGIFSLALKKACQAREVYGIEISEKAVDISRSRGVTAVALNMDEAAFPFEDNYFDAIFCGEVIEHLFDPDHLLDEIYRVLKPGGVCVLTTPNLASWHNRIALLLGFQPFYTHVSLRHNVGKFKNRDRVGGGHIRVFVYRAIKELVQIHQFKIRKIQGTHEAGLFPFPLNYLVNIPSTIPSLSTMLIFVLTKTANISKSA